MATFYKGDEIKFAINLEVAGFSMDDDDFDIEVKSGNTSLKGSKGAGSKASTDIVIFKDPVTVSTWYAIVDTAKLPVGNMRVIATAHVIDANANDGVRKSIAVEKLGNLAEP